MSILHANSLYAKAQCDMDYGKYVEGNSRYVPCTLTASLGDVEELANAIVSYVCEFTRSQGLIKADVKGGVIEVKIYEGIMNTGYSIGEVVYRVLNFIDGYVECLRHGARK